MHDIAIGCSTDINRSDAIKGILVEDRQTNSGQTFRFYTTTNGQVCLRQIEQIPKKELEKSIIIDSRDINKKCKAEQMPFEFISEDTAIVNKYYGILKLINEKFPDNVDNILETGHDKPTKFLLFRAENMEIIEKFLDTTKDIKSYGEIYYRSLSAFQNVVYFEKGLKTVAILGKGLKEQ